MKGWTKRKRERYIGREIQRCTRRGREIYSKKRKRDRERYRDKGRYNKRGRDSEIQRGREIEKQRDKEVERYCTYCYKRAVEMTVFSRETWTYSNATSLRAVTSTVVHHNESSCVTPLHLSRQREYCLSNYLVSNHRRSYYVDDRRKSCERREERKRVRERDRERQRKREGDRVRERGEKKHTSLRNSVGPSASCSFHPTRRPSVSINNTSSSVNGFT